MAIKPVEILIRAKDQASGVFDSIRGKAGALAAAIAGYFGFSAFVGAVRGAAELEAKLSEVRAVSGATAAEMQELRKAAEDAGGTTKFTATEAADALGNLARSGLSAKQSIQALPAVLQLAQAGGIGLAESSEYVTKTLAGFVLQADQAGRIADVLAAGANASNTSVTGLAQALSYAAPVAKSLGLDLETTVAIIGKFADGGIDASRAGTALNAILSQFQDPASKFRQELAAAGIVTDDFREALRQLAKAGPAGQKAIIAVGTEAGPALRSLLNQGIGAMEDLDKRLRNVKGSAQSTASVMEDNLTGALNNLSSAWDTVTNALATPVLPVLREGFERLSATLQEAVASGGVTRFGQALADGFRSAIEWARAFFGQVDPQQLAQRMQELADSAREGFRQFGEYARNAGNIVQTVYGVMSAGGNAVMLVVYGIGQAWATTAQGVMNGVALLKEGLASVTFGDLSKRFAAEAKEARASAGGFGAAADAMQEKATAAFDAMARGAENARAGWSGLTSDLQDVGSQAERSARVLDTVAETLKEIGGDATATGQKALASAVMQKQAADQARAAVGQLKTEYEAALAAGDVQLAVQKLDTMRKALQATGAQASVTAQDVENAFTRLGVTSAAELQRLADGAKRDFELVKASGTATAFDIANAFIAYATKAIAANKGVVPEFIKTEGAIRGVEIATDAAGNTTLRVADRITGATGSMSKGWRDVGNSARRAGDDALYAAEQAKRASEIIREMNARHSAPDGQRIVAATREERLAGQGSLDLSNQFDIRERMRRGALTPDDLPEMQAVLQQLEANESVNRSLDRINPAAIDLAGQRDRQEWNAVRTQLQQLIATMGGSGGARISRTVRVEMPGGPVETDERGAQNIIRSLQGAKLAAGR